MQYLTDQQVEDFLKTQSGPYEWQSIKACAGAQMLQHYYPKEKIYGFGYSFGNAGPHQVSVSINAAAAMYLGQTFEGALSLLRTGTASQDMNLPSWVTHVDH